MCIKVQRLIKCLSVSLKMLLTLFLFITVDDAEIPAEGPRVVSNLQ